MRRLRSLFIICISSIIIFSCTAIIEYNLINNTKVEPTRVMLKDKSILLTPIVHFGQKEFFDNLTDSIVTWKGMGYIVFFEEMNIGPHERDVPVEEYTIIFRKFRKMMGGTPTRDHYAELQKDFPDAITQPLYSELGVDSLDFNADVTIKEFVDEYERLYGEAVLEPCDLNTHLDSLFTCDKLTNDMNPVIDDFRNKMLIKQLVEAKEKKIVVLYGAHHIQPLEKALKAL